MREAVIVSLPEPRSARQEGQPQGHPPRGVRRGRYSRSSIRRTPGLEPAMVDDVIFGCAMPEGEQGMNIARVISLLGRLPAPRSPR